MNTYNEYGQRGGEQTGEHREGRVARAIERRTANVPSDIFLWAAGASVVGSLVFQIFGSATPKRRMLGMFGGGAPSKAPLSSFIGLWVPSLLLLGVYNKIVKVAGSDQYTR